MFTTYKAQVIKTYEKKKVEGLLPLNLQLPTPAKLKDECLAIIAHRFSIKDKEALTQFFGHSESNFEREIRKVEIDKFKPLVNFLKGKTQETEDRNIELLAWLIDFNPRPYLFGCSYADDAAIKKDVKTENVTVEEKPNNQKKSFENTEVNNPSFEQEKKKINNIDDRQKKTLVRTSKFKYAASFTIIVILGLLFFYSGISWISNPFNNKNYMYWAKDHYEAIDDDQTILNKQIIKLDKDRLQNFKKITRLDTLKEECIGKIWYSKINNEVEFYTTSGMHPEHTEKSLKLVSKHIFDTYIAKTASQKKN